MYYPRENEVKCDVSENLVRFTFTSHGYYVEPHGIYEPGCDGIFHGNGITFGDYEVNYWKPDSYFSDERITSLDSNLYNGIEWKDEQYVMHGDNGDNIKYRFHFSFGATRSEAQISQAKELGITYIHTETLPTSDELWSLISPFLEGNPHLKFYKVNCIGNNHLQNDRTSMMVLLTPIISITLSKIQGFTGKITNKIKCFKYKVKLKRSLLGLNSLEMQTPWIFPCKVFNHYNNNQYLSKWKICESVNGIS